MRGPNGERAFLLKLGGLVVDHPALGGHPVQGNFETVEKFITMMKELEEDPEKHQPIEVKRFKGSNKADSLYMPISPEGIMLGHAAKALSNMHAIWVYLPRDPNGGLKQRDEPIVLTKKKKLFGAPATAGQLFGMWTDTPVTIPHATIQNIAAMFQEYEPPSILHNTIPGGVGTTIIPLAPEEAL